MPENWGRTRAEVSISEFKRLADDATIEEVETPDSRKDVEIAYQASYGFEVESGTAIGVYFEPSRMNPDRVHIDWADGRERTTVEWGDVETFEESDYYNE